MLMFRALCAESIDFTSLLDNAHKARDVGAWRAEQVIVTDALTLMPDKKWLKSSINYVRLMLDISQC